MCVCLVDVRGWDPGSSGREGGGVSGGPSAKARPGSRTSAAKGQGARARAARDPRGGGGGQSGESGEERRERDEAQRAPRARARARERIGSKARSYVSCALRFPPKVAEHAPCKLCSQPTRSLSARFFEATSWQARHVPKDV